MMPVRDDSPIDFPSSDYSSPRLSPPFRDDLSETLQSLSIDSLGNGIDPSVLSPSAKWSLKFFDFPFEVRERIYRYALVPGKIFVKPFISFRYVEDGAYLSTYTPPNLALLRASKGIYSEACFTFYRENIFCFVQPDILVTLLQVSPRRMRDLLKHMHKVELVFDYRDYQFMTDDLCRGLQKSTDSLHQIQSATPLDGREDGARPSSDQISNTIVSLTQLRSYILGHHLRRSKSDRLSNSWIESMHAHNLTILRTYLWGRSLTFIAQNLLVTDLYLDFENCYCPGGCCRLAREVMGWCWSKWVYGLPMNVHITNATEEERMVVLDGIRRLGVDDGEIRLPERAKEMRVGPIPRPLTWTA